MWKYLTTLLVLLTMGGLGAAQVSECTDCYSNIITQIDTQVIDTVRLGLGSPNDLGEDVDTVAVVNEGLSAAVIVTPESIDPINNSMYSQTGFARIDQDMYQSISNLGSANISDGEGAKGVTWNKALQAAWIVNQGQKELNLTSKVWEKEGAYIAQSTTQIIDNVYDYDSREAGKVMNVDNKLAMIVDDLETIVNLTAKATSVSSDSQASSGNITNNVYGNITTVDP
jgi:hypothetical protein